MPKGGARVNSGPAPDPNALRRDRAKDKDGWRSLPVEGRAGPAPDWPLPPEVTTATRLALAYDQREIVEAQIDGGDAPRTAPAKLARLDQMIAELEHRQRAAAEMELGLWTTLWATPVAIAWEDLRWTREVALYVRWQVQAELGDLDAGKEARQWSDRLGLNPPALMRLRWRIDAAPAAAPAPRGTPRRASARDRLKLVGPSASA